MSAQTAIWSVLCHSVESFSRAYIPTKFESRFVWYWFSGLAGTLKAWLDQCYAKLINQRA